LADSSVLEMEFIHASGSLPRAECGEMKQRGTGPGSASRDRDRSACRHRQEGSLSSGVRNHQWIRGDHVLRRDKLAITM